MFGTEVVIVIAHAQATFRFAWLYWIFLFPQEEL